MILEVVETEERTIAVFNLDFLADYGDSFFGKSGDLSIAIIREEKILKIGLKELKFESLIVREHGKVIWMIPEPDLPTMVSADC